jgi:hypothetical protein
MSHTRTRYELAEFPLGAEVFGRRSSACHLRSPPFGLPEPAGDGPHQGTELLDAEQARAESVEQDGAATADYRGD